MRALTIFVVFVALASSCAFSQEVKTIEELRAAAEQGNAKAQYAIGQMYRFGKRVPQDYEYAFKWYRMAAEQGLPDAQNDLSMMYSDGEVVSHVKGGVNLDHFGGAKVDQLVKG